MQFDVNNPIVKRCGEAMMLEGEGKIAEAQKVCKKAWLEASNDLEKFVSAHYLARHQESILNKLKWDQLALEFAANIGDESVAGAFPSLYLNIGKCYEDLGDYHLADNNYRKALAFASALGDDGYGEMIRKGISAGLDRVNRANPKPIAP